MVRNLAVLLGLALATVAGPALAGNCAGFTDVSDASSFCGDVSWIKNRAITLGCGNGTTYCPNDAVSRLQMAAFLHRLGNETFLQGGNAFGATAVLGTGDDQPLELWVGGQRVARFQPNAVVFSNTPAPPNVLLGYAGNGVYTNVSGATVAGGGAPGGQNAFAEGSWQCTLGYGCLNGVTDLYGTIGGGAGNLAGNGDNDVRNTEFATVGGGLSNWANADGTTIGGGVVNLANGSSATVAGGYFNRAGGVNASIGGGISNLANGREAAIPGGNSNKASGTGSFAAGSHANAANDGCFVFGDKWTVSDVTCGAPNQFVARAIGGFYLFTNGYNDSNYTGVQLTPGASAWSTFSDRNGKENVSTVDPVDVLDRLNAIPIATWNWKAQDAAIRHMGPMAQDFHAAFALGEDERHISTVDADGVALAAIQGLYRVVRAKDARITEQQGRIADQERVLAEQSGRLDAQQAELDAVRREISALRALADDVAFVKSGMAALVQAMRFGQRVATREDLNPP